MLLLSIANTYFYSSLKVNERRFPISDTVYILTKRHSKRGLKDKLTARRKGMTLGIERAITKKINNPSPKALISCMPLRVIEGQVRVLPMYSKNRIEVSQEDWCHN